MSRQNIQTPKAYLLYLICAGASLLAATTGLAQTDRLSAVSALGRLEPEHGVLRITAPSTSEAISGSVIAELLVEEGDWVEAGQLLATTDSTAMARVLHKKTEAELELAVRAAKATNSEADEACTLAEVAASEAARRTDLLQRNLASTEEAEHAQGDAHAKAASCTAARAEARVAESAIEVARIQVAVEEVAIERSLVRAPVAARVLEIHARAGEFTMPNGVLDLGRTDRMYAVAEVFETDINRVSIGQRARVTSDVLQQPLSGTVERIRGKVQKLDVIGANPAADRDARIIEVEIRLDDSEAAAGLTNLQVEILIGS